MWQLLRSRCVCYGQTTCQGAPKRFFWQSIDVAFNKPDEKRIKEVGPDRACAEWILRCGGNVRWKDTGRFLKDYNKLAMIPKGKVIEEIDAENTGINGMGFKHFDGCKYIKKIRLNKCDLVWDSALWELPMYLKDSLEHLEVGNCGDISEEGLKACLKLPLLRSALFYDLARVKDPKAILLELQQALPECKVDYPDATREN